MPVSPSLDRHGYDRITRALHWIIAVAILGTLVLGLIMTRLPATSEAEVARVFRAYSVHKTLGVLILALACFRLVWTLGHSGPGPLHPERRVETFLARLVHAALWGAMFLLPLSGWLHHSAAPGFAPILWPFGQSLPFVLPDEGWALIFRSIHATAGWLLIVALALHVAGALKHALVDRDATLARMVRGTGPATAPAGPPRTALGAALALWLAAVLFAIQTTPAPEPDPFDTIDLPVGVDEPTPPAD